MLITHTYPTQDAQLPPVSAFQSRLQRVSSWTLGMACARYTMLLNSQPLSMSSSPSSPIDESALCSVQVSTLSDLVDPEETYSRRCAGVLSLMWTIRMIFKQSTTVDPSVRKQKHGGRMLATSSRSDPGFVEEGRIKLTLNNSARAFVTGNPVPCCQQTWTTPSDPLAPSCSWASRVWDVNP
jgi:hypothetical protein